MIYYIGATGPLLRGDPHGDLNTAAGGLIGCGRNRPQPTRSTLALVEPMQIVDMIVRLGV
jgi:hypothetical protein